MPTAKSAAPKATSAKKAARSRPAAPVPAPAVAAAPTEASVTAPVAAVAPISPVPAPAPEAASRKSADESRKPAKPKLVRDSFTMPQADFDLVAVLKQRALGFKRPVKKSELLRAGLHALNALSDKRLQGALDALEPLKPGRPRKGD